MSGSQTGPQIVRDVAAALTGQDAVPKIKGRFFQGIQVLGSMPPMLRDAFTPPLTLLTEITLLVLMLWPAPVPIGHRHRAGESREADRQMVQHLQSHHGGVSNADNWPEDWHWHWVCRGDAYVGLAGEKVAAGTDQMSPNEPVVLAEMSCADLFESVSWDRASSQPRIPEHRRYSFQSVALLNSGLSLPELLGVMRI